MKNSKIIRCICYVLIPILIAVFFMSLTYLIAINDNVYTSEENYFNSSQFKFLYMDQINSKMNQLIFAQDDYETIQDGEYTIYFDKYDNFLFGIDNFSEGLFIYKNKALTNIKLSENTDTIEEIKNFILNNKPNNLCYENGKFSSNLSGFAESVSDYADITPIIYYSKKDINDTFNEELDEIQIYATESDLPQESGGFEEIVEYHKARLEDFTYYTSFNNTLEGNNEINIIINVLKNIKPYESEIILCLPISAILILIIVFYLINSIGHVEGKEEIEIVDFDKIPLEIILGLFCIIFAISCLCLCELFDFNKMNLNSIITLFTSLYAINIILLEIMVVTIIRRIKAKKFINTCLSCKIIIWSWRFCIKFIKGIFNLLHNCIKRIRKMIQKIYNNISLNLKLFVISVMFLILDFILTICFGPIGFAIIMGIYIYIVYKILLRIESFKKLEKSLKSIYDGEKVVLYEKDFSVEFEKSIKYVNDISNGFENAINEGLKSERLKTELITNVSHDIKTPLTSIINYVDLIKKENIDNEKIKEYVDILDNKSQRLKKLTEDLVEVSKASSGNVSLNLEEINILELLNQALGEFKDKFEEKKLEIISNLPKESIKIKADNKYVYRIIENLFVNISKYALDSSRVYVEVEKKDNKAKIILKNISKDRLNITEEELMQRFVRGDKSRTTEGSGLGLAIAKSLTQLQGGNLNCKIDGDLFKVEIEFDII